MYHVQLKIGFYLQFNQEGDCLVTFFIYFILFLGILLVTHRVVRSLRLRKNIRKMLRQELQVVHPELSRWKDHPGQQFEILKPVYNTVSYTVKRKFSVNPKRIDDLIDRELNRLIKGSWSRFTSFFELMLLRLIASVFVLGSIVQGSLVFVTYQETSFKTGFTQWLGTPDEADARSPIEIPKSAVGMTPKATRYTLPAQVTSTEEMGQALAYHISRHDKQFVIRYVGRAESFTKVSGQAWEWLQHHEPYLMRLYKGGDGQSLDYGSYIDYEVTVDYALTPEQMNHVDEKVKQIVQKIPNDWSDDKKVRYVNDYIVRHTTYKLKSKESPYTPYSILFNGEGVCEGYALTAYLLLQAAGVDIRYISGHAGGGLHAWNMVKLEGQWYHLDTTWNDPIPNRPDEVQEDYLLVSDQTLSKDHTWNKKQYPHTAQNDY